MHGHHGPAGAGADLVQPGERPDVRLLDHRHHQPLRHSRPHFYNVSRNIESKYPFSKSY